jgi:hypothetical protein
LLSFLRIAELIFSFVKFPDGTTATVAATLGAEGRIRAVVDGRAISGAVVAHKRTLVALFP